MGHIGRYSDVCLHGEEMGKCENCYEEIKKGKHSDLLIDYSRRERIQKEDREKYEREVLKLKVINLFAGPCAGKSVTRASLFSLMKKKGIECEEATEYAKDVTWEGNLAKLSDQLYILAKQNRKLERLKGKVDWVISDSPLLLSLHYTPLHYFPKTFQSMVLELWDSYDNYNFFVNRTGEYNPNGRNQTKEEALNIDGQIKAMLANKYIKFSEVDAGPDTEHEIYQLLLTNGAFK